VSESRIYSTAWHRVYSLTPYTHVTATRYGSHKCVYRVSESHHVFYYMAWCVFSHTLHTCHLQRVASRTGVCVGCQKIVMYSTAWHCVYSLTPYTHVTASRGESHRCVYRVSETQVCV